MKLSLYPLRNTVIGTVVIHAIVTAPKIGPIFTQKNPEVCETF